MLVQENEENHQGKVAATAIFNSYCGKRSTPDR